MCPTPAKPLLPTVCGSFLKGVGQWDTHTHPIRGCV
nr:MAG TPA: hypothetical protein [Caudoviricetes sp.]